MVKVKVTHETFRVRNIVALIWVSGNLSQNAGSICLLLRCYIKHGARALLPDTVIDDIMSES